MKGLHSIWMLLLVSINVLASPQEGKRIAIEVDKRDSGFVDMQADLKMTLKNRQGKVSVRKLSIKTLEQQNEGDKSIVEFHHPRDVDGTKLLTFTHKRSDDDQWLYLPALSRVKRIATRNQSGPFMGSEFAYEDMTSQEVEKYTYNYLNDTKCGALDCYIVERVPVNPYSGYKKQLVWVDKSEYRVQKIEFYDRKGSKLKTLQISGYKKYLGHLWRAKVFQMDNHQTGKSTTLEWNNYQFKTGIAANQFNKSKLSR